MTRLIVFALLVVALPARAEPERFYVRGGVLHVMPFSDSRELQLSNVGGPASLAVSDGPVRGSGTTVDTMTMPAAILGYRLRSFGGRFAVETVLAPPVKVRFHGTGTLADESIAPMALGIPTGVPALGSELGEAKAVPPVVTMVYRLLDREAFQPYVGLGGSLLIAYDARATNAVLTEVSQPDVHLDPAAGLVLQAGLDARIWRRVRARIDLKYIAFMKAHATVENIHVRTPGLPLLEEVAVGTATMDVWVNPLIVQFGVGVDFW